MPADPRRVKELFVAAADLTDPAERRALLDRECGADADLRQRVEQLLRAHDQPASALEHPLGVAADPGTRAIPPTDATADRPPESTAAVGDRVGPYKLLEKIGEGGMGEVWVADQLEPIKRRIALKLIKPGMDSRSVLGRFEAERQALAVMDHPNIAKVLDAGTTADGRPYFVMELVKGTPITEFADARKVTTKQRLELFVPVCQAIQHAHMKGIIHRDIKPSNVLVALHDETPVPKVIDFGVAKAVGQQLTEKTIYTGFGALVGTPAYMAPEQATFNQLDVDTRADVYALGVLLYELLAGSPPIERDRLKKAALDEVLRIVRDEEPPRPSQRLSTSQAKASIAATRGSEPAKLSQLMKGELDWIVMKALEKDRTRRYETANGFAADVQRYLSGEQVQAVPPSLGYRLRKFCRRNKEGLLTVTVAAVLLLAGSAIGVSLNIHFEHAAREAARNEREKLSHQIDQLDPLARVVDRPEEQQVVAGIESISKKPELAPEDVQLLMFALLSQNVAVSLAGEEALAPRGPEAWPVVRRILVRGNHHEVRRVALLLARWPLDEMLTQEQTTEAVHILLSHWPQADAERGWLLTRGMAGLTDYDKAHASRELMPSRKGHILFIALRRFGRMGVTALLNAPENPGGLQIKIRAASLLDPRYAPEIMVWLASVIKARSWDSREDRPNCWPGQREEITSVRTEAMKALTQFGSEGEAVLLDLLAAYPNTSPIWDDARSCVPTLLSSRR